MMRDGEDHEEEEERRERWGSERGEERGMKGESERLNESY